MELPNRLLLNAFEDDAVLKIADKFLGEHLGKKDSTCNYVRMPLIFDKRR